MSENNYPHVCQEVGMSCEECTGTTAAEMARLCRGLRGKAVGQLFVQIYTHPACSPMRSHFAAVYQEASELEVPRPQAVRREVGRPLYRVAAVA